MTKNDEECHADELPRITLHRIAGSIMKGRKSARKKRGKGKQSMEEGKLWFLLARAVGRIKRG